MNVRNVYGVINKRTLLGRRKILAAGNIAVIAVMSTYYIWTQLRNEAPVKFDISRFF